MAIETTSLVGKRILVTGGTTGIGRAVVAQLAAAGGRVLTFGRHPAELKDALDNARTSGNGEAMGIIADIAQPDAVDEVFAAVDAQLGGLDILINNAGLGIDPVQETNETDWRYGVETDFVAYLACAQEAMARMTYGGHIVFVGSISAENKGKGSSVYAAVKAGIKVYAETLRKEVLKDHIKITTIEPGAVGADMQKKTPEEQREAIAKEEMLFAEELADTIKFALTRSSRTDITMLRVEPTLGAR